jgi:hypothetical protein
MNRAVCIFGLHYNESDDEITRSVNTKELICGAVTKSIPIFHAQELPIPGRMDFLKLISASEAYNELSIPLQKIFIGCRCLIHRCAEGVARASNLESTSSFVATRELIDLEIP